MRTSAIIPEARADWMNLTGAETAPNIAEITILDDRVRVALEVYVGDLVDDEGTWKLAGITVVDAKTLN